jgi:hypothetical protein
MTTLQKTARALHQAKHPRLDLVIRVLQNQLPIQRWLLLHRWPSDFDAEKRHLAHDYLQRNCHVAHVVTFVNCEWVPHQDHLYLLERVGQGAIVVNQSHPKGLLYHDHAVEPCAGSVDHADCVQSRHLALLASSAHPEHADVFDSS